MSKLSVWPIPMLAFVASTVAKPEPSGRPASSRIQSPAPDQQGKSTSWEVYRNDAERLSHLGNQVCDAESSRAEFSFSLNCVDSSRIPFDTFRLLRRLLSRWTAAGQGEGFYIVRQRDKLAPAVLYRQLAG